MPRNVRNFFLELEVDGRKSTIRTGPVSKGGGFSLTIRIRESGDISSKYLLVRGIERDGLLNLSALPVNTGSGQAVDIVTLRDTRKERRAPKPLAPKSLPPFIDLQEVRHG